MPGDAGKVSDKGKGQALSKSKGTDFLRKATQDAERQYLRNKPEADLGSTSQLKDLKSKSGKHSASRHSDTKLQIDQTLWQKLRPNDRRTPNSRQRQPDATQSSRRSLQRRLGAPHLGERPRNSGQRKDTPALRGGGDPDDSSSQQQDITSNDLLRLANEAKSLRLEHELLHLKERALDPSTSTSDLLGISKRTNEITKDTMEVAQERARLANQ